MKNHINFKFNKILNKEKMHLKIYQLIIIKIQIVDKIIFIKNYLKTN